LLSSDFAVFDSCYLPFIAYKELKIAQTVQINQLFKLLMYANEFKTKEKQKLTEIKKLTAANTSVHLVFR